MDLAVGKHLVEAGEGFAGAGKDDEAADGTVEAMDHAEEDLAGLLVFLLDVLLHDVRERAVAGLVALHDLAALLVDDDDVVVFVDYLHVWFRLFDDDFPGGAIGLAHDVDAAGQVVAAGSCAVSLQGVVVRGGGGGRCGDGRRYAFAKVEGGQAVGHLHGGDGLRHKQRAFGILVVERGRRLRRVGQLVVAVVGVGPLAAVGGQQPVVGREDGVSFQRVCIRHLAVPYLQVVVYVEDDDAAARELTIPACGLTVLYDVVFVGVSVIAYQVGHRLIGRAGHVVDDGVARQLRRLQPSHQHTLMGRVAWRTEAALVVVAVVHEVPVVDEGCAAVVEVGQSVAVAVLMADGAERAVAGAYQLLYAAVLVDDVVLVAAAHMVGLAVLVLAEPPLVGPDGISVAAGIHALAGIDDEQLLYLSVVVPVVQAPVYAPCLQRVGYVLHQVFRVLVVIVGAPVFPGLVGQRDEVQVEREVELAVALRHEVVVNRTVERRFRQSLLIEHPLPQRQGVLLLERLVAERRQHHQLPMAAGGRRAEQRMVERGST